MTYLGKSIEQEMFYGAKPKIFEKARELRNTSTLAEKALWKHIRNKKLSGFAFRRQHPIDIYIVDFYCHIKKLAIEVDGEIHNSRFAKEKDEGRTAEIEQFGINLIRFTNKEVLENISQVLKTIEFHLTTPLQPPP